MNSPIEKLLWSMALPGFGQFLNGKVVKGIVLLILEFLVNVQANFNVVIILSFQGETKSNRRSKLSVVDVLPLSIFLCDVGCL